MYLSHLSLRIRFIPKIEYIIISNYELTTNLFYDVNVKTKEWSEVTLQFFDSDMNIIRNHDVDIEMQVLQGPSYAYNLDLDWSQEISLDNNERIDEKGHMKLR